MKCETFEDARLNDATVRAGMEANSGAEAIIVALVNQKLDLLERLMKLYAIAPRKITVNGTTYIWHCPDELIPSEKL